MPRAFRPFLRARSAAFWASASVSKASDLGPKPRMIVANHVSWSDILVLASRETPCFVAKSEVATGRCWALSPGCRIRFSSSARAGQRCPASMPPWRQRWWRAKTSYCSARARRATARACLTFKPSHFAAARESFRLFPEVEAVTVQPAAIAYTHARGKPLDASEPPRFGLVRRRRPRAAYLAAAEKRAGRLRRQLRRAALISSPKAIARPWRWKRSSACGRSPRRRSTKIGCVSEIDQASKNCAGFLIGGGKIGY